MRGPRPRAAASQEFIIRLETVLLGIPVTDRTRCLLEVVKAVKRGDKNARSVSDAGNLIAHYKPSVIAIEGPQGSLRGSRIRMLTKEISALTQDTDIKVERFSRKQVNLGIFREEQGT